MTVRGWMAVTCAALAWVLPATGQELTVSDRLVELAAVLGRTSGAGSADKIAAIEEIGSLRAVSVLASGLLFDRASVRFEGDPKVREAAAANLRFVLGRRNRMEALRLARIANPHEEPDPRVRMAALRTLAGLEASEAASAVQDAATEAGEPDPEVRRVALELLRKGLAGSNL